MEKDNFNTVFFNEILVKKPLTQNTFGKRSL